MCDLSLHGVLRVCQKGGGGEGRGGEGRGGGRDCSLTLCISIRWGRGKEVMGNFLGYDLLWCTMFSFEKGRSAFKKKMVLSTHLSPI